MALQLRPPSKHVTHTYLMSLFGALLLTLASYFLREISLLWQGAQPSAMTPLGLLLRVGGFLLIVAVVGILTWPFYYFILDNRSYQGVFLFVWPIGVATAAVLSLLNAYVGLPAGVIALVIALSLYPKYYPRFMPGHCPECGYDVVSRIPEDGICPECGKALSKQDKRESSNRGEVT